MDRVKVKERAGLQFETIKEAAGFSVRRSPWGNAQGNTVDFGFGADDVPWLVEHLGDWVRQYAGVNVSRLQDLFIRGDVTTSAPSPVPTPGGAVQTEAPRQGPAT